MRRGAWIGALVVVATSAHAAPQPLGEDELRTAVGGKTVKIDTPLGMPITVTYGANGIMTGTANAALAVYLGATKDRGRWTIRNGRLCQKWFKWLSGDTTCLSIHQDGLKIFWRSDEGKTGTAMIEPGPPVLEGATASGLGLPPQPDQPEPRVAQEAQSQDPPDRPEPTSPTAAQAPPPRATRAPLARPPSHARVEVAVEAPPLLESPREVTRPFSAVAEPQALRFIAASLTPSGPALSQDVFRHSLARPADADPFAAEPQSMREAADLASRDAMEHRWCLANAFAKAPAPLSTGIGDDAPAGELLGTPSLLAVSQEQAYGGELPLHEASCLTAEPAIGLMGRLTAFRRDPR